MLCWRTCIVVNWRQFNRWKINWSIQFCLTHKQIGWIVNFFLSKGFYSAKSFLMCLLRIWWWTIFQKFWQLRYIHVDSWHHISSLGYFNVSLANWHHYLYCLEVLFFPIYLDFLPKVFTIWMDSKNHTIEVCLVIICPYFFIFPFS